MFYPEFLWHSCGTVPDPRAHILRCSERPMSLSLLLHLSPATWKLNCFKRYEQMGFKFCKGMEVSSGMMLYVLFVSSFRIKALSLICLRKVR